MEYKKPKGTRDILPDKIKLWQFMENNARNIAKTYNYNEIRTPTFEECSLYKRSVGDTSDIVSKEMYEFEDKGNRKMALRPEGTAGVVRAVVENGLLNSALPLKFYYFSNCFRYENTQKGRYREFSQLGFECFGTQSPETDAELIILIDKYLKSLGIKNSTLLLNSIGCPKCRAEYNKALQNYALKYESELCNDCKRRLKENPLRMLDCKQERCKQIFENAPTLIDYLCSDCKNHFETLKTILRNEKIEYKLDNHLVRGLDYYTKTVFEFEHDGFDNKKLTVAAGGRYDNLVEEIGGKSCSAVGVGIGLDRLVELVDITNIEQKPLYYILNTDDVELAKILPIAEILRNKGYNVEVNLAKRSVNAQQKYMNNINADYLIFIGKQELEKHYANIKDLKTREILDEKVTF